MVWLEGRLNNLKSSPEIVEATVLGADFYRFERVQGYCHGFKIDFISNGRKLEMTYSMFLERTQRDPNRLSDVIVAVARLLWTAKVNNLQELVGRRALLEVFGGYHASTIKKFID